MRLPQSFKDPSWDLVHVAVEEERVKVHGGSDRREGHLDPLVTISRIVMTQGRKSASLNLPFCFLCFLSCSCRLSLEQVSQQDNIDLLLLPATGTRAWTEARQVDDERLTDFTALGPGLWQVSFFVLFHFFLPAQVYWFGRAGILNQGGRRMPFSSGDHACDTMFFFT